MYRYICILYITCFCTCTHPDIPRLHHIKRLRTSLNSDIETISLPTPYIGKYMHFQDIVTKTLAAVVSWHRSKYNHYIQYFPLIKLEKTHVPPQTCITLKLSGDGAKIAATSSMVFLTFSFPGLADNVLSAAGTVDK